VKERKDKDAFRWINNDSCVASLYYFFIYRVRSARSHPETIRSTTGLNQTSTAVSKIHPTPVIL
jgi:hypothetical protein